MHSTSAPRHLGRRLAVLCLALLAACSLLTGTARPAHADTTQRWTVIDFNMSNYDRHFPESTPETAANATRYGQMVEQLRELGSHQLAYAQEGMRQSPQVLNSNIIEMRIWRNFRSDVALYFSANNLYLLGFSVDGAHWQFSDTPGTLAAEMQHHYGGPLPLFQSLGYSGHYRYLDPQETRGNFRYTSENLNNAVQRLRQVRSGNTRDYRSDLAAVIGATSEAARFGWIQRRIKTVIEDGYDYTDPNNPAHLGNFGVGLENEWSSLSRVTHQSLRGESTRPVNVDGRNYSSWQQIRNGTPELPRVGPFIALYASGN